jgi:hypothetical protein
VNTARKGRGGAVTSVPFSARIRAVWDPSQRATAKALVAAVLAFLCSLVVSCSGETAGEDRATTGQPEDREESTLLASPDDGPETTGEGSLPEATLGPAPDAPGVLLRLEGDPETTFSGICAVGGKESILSGRIPKRTSRTQVARMGFE